MPRELCKWHFVHVQTPHACVQKQPDNLQDDRSGETVQDTGPRLFLEHCFLVHTVHTVALCFSLDPRVLSLWPHRQSHPQTKHHRQQPRLTSLPTKEHKA